MERAITSSPYDLERDYFVYKMTKYVDFLEDIDSFTLSKLYQKSETKLYHKHQILFESGDFCSSIYLILSGVVEISLIHCDGQVTPMDVCGRGTIIGFSNVLGKEKWIYRATAKSADVTQVIEVSGTVIKYLSRKNKALMISIEKQLNVQNI